MAPALRAAALPIVLATLGACGGGGSGGGVIVPEAPPASFASAGANQAIVMEGKSAALLVTAGVSPDVMFTPTGVGTIDNATVRFSFDGASQLSGIRITSPQATLSFDRNSPDHTLECASGLCVAESPGGGVLAIDPFAEHWNYQTFGVWVMDAGLPSIRLGAISAGGPTSGSALPTSGTATFNGLAAGLYIDTAGTPWGTAAMMKADVSFGSRTILFSTSKTFVASDPQAARAGALDENLNLSGTLSYAQGINNFSGTVTTQNGQLTGRSEGRFYGPAAEEIGGVYSLSGSGPSRLIGGFGGKRRE
jgi:C-lobe and N-lobe beta barrels of Tf-binding protein B